MAGKAKLRECAFEERGSSGARGRFLREHKTCPFCASHNIWPSSRDQIRCLRCGASGPIASICDGKFSWNDRPDAGRAHLASSGKDD